MRIEHTHHIVVTTEKPIQVAHTFTEDPARLDRIEAAVVAILKIVTQTQQTEVLMKAELDALQAQVETTNTLEQSAVQLITGIADMIASAAGDKARVLKLTEDLKAAAGPLSDAIKANTPQA